MCIRCNIMVYFDENAVFPYLYLYFGKFMFENIVKKHVRVYNLRI